MDAFDDGFGGEGEVEVDPAAEFLAKEQEELGDIGECFPQIIYECFRQKPSSIQEQNFEHIYRGGPWSFRRATT